MMLAMLDAADEPKDMNQPGLRLHPLKGTSINTESPLASRAFRDQGGFPKAGWLPVEGSQHRDREALEAPQGAAKTPIRGVALLAKGYGHCRRRAPCGLSVLDSRRDDSVLIEVPSREA